LVIGISSEPDAKKLESALSAQQIDVGKVKVLASDGDDSESSGLTFLEVATEVDSETFGDDIMRGTGVLADSGGTSVPGLSGYQDRLDVFSHQSGTTRHYLAGFPVPDDEVENFDDAIAEGRAVVLYPDAGADAQKIVAAFRAAGLQNVRSY
jgi:predicted dehydrogenase